MAADGTPSMADVWLDAHSRPEAVYAPAGGAYFSPQYMGGRIDTNEENPMSEPLDPQDAQNPDDTSGTADDAAALQGDIATDSDDE